MDKQAEVLRAEAGFFDSLIRADLGGLERVLANDFLLIDVMMGAKITKASLLAVMGSGQLRFEAIAPDISDILVRIYQGTAVVTGRTQMHGRFDGEPFSAASRYTHVFVEYDGAWRLVTAQGTQIRE